jgi:hypothetical protein
MDRDLGMVLEIGRECSGQEHFLEEVLLEVVEHGVMEMRGSQWLVRRKVVMELWRSGLRREALNREICVLRQRQSPTALPHKILGSTASQPQL